MKQFIGITLMGLVLGYAVLRDKIKEEAADIMNAAIEKERQEKLSARRRRLDR